MENEVSCTEEQMEGAVGDRAWAGTSKKISKGNVKGICPEVFRFGPPRKRTSGKV